jgi:hypothetical protein
MLKNVRVSFPHLFTRPIINGEEGKCGAALMLDPDAHQQTLLKLNEEIDNLIQTKWNGKVKIPSDKRCLRDGEDKGRAEYEGYMVLSANSSDRPVVLRGNGRDTIEDERDCPIYAGCYVNAKVRLWAQDNQFGKRINCELVAIQFAGEGAPLDGTHVSREQAMDGFDAIDEDEDDFLAA